MSSARHPRLLQAFGAEDVPLGSRVAPFVSFRAFSKVCTACDPMTSRRLGLKESLLRSWEAKSWTEVGMSWEEFSANPTFMGKRIRDKEGRSRAKRPSFSRAGGLSAAALGELLGKNSS